MTAEELSRAIDQVGRRLEAMHDDQRRIIEKLNRMRLVIESIREEQARLAADLTKAQKAPAAGR